MLLTDKQIEWQTEKTKRRCTENIISLAEINGDLQLYCEGKSKAIYFNVGYLYHIQPTCYLP